MVGTKEINCSSGTKCLLADYCSTKSNEFLKKHISKLTFPKKQMIFNENWPVLGMYFIRQGKALVSFKGKKNKNQILRLASVGDLLGVCGFSTGRYVGSCKSLEDSTMCFIQKETLLDILKHNASITLKLIENFSELITFYEIRQKHLSQMSTVGKIAEALLIALKAYGKKVNGGYLIDVFLSRHDLGDIAGISTEGAIRTLQEFKRKKLVALERRKILILQLDKLSEIITDECCEYNNFSNCLHHLFDKN